MKLFSTIKDNPLLSFLIALLVLAFGAFVGVLLSECSEKYISKLLGLCEKNEALKFLGISMGGILIALQALMSYKRAKAMETTAEAQADAAKAQADAVSKTEQGQRQDRLKNAIEHLGHEKDSVRLGGAYELFHLAKDIKELRQTVLDILCAHIRQTTGDDGYRETHKSKPSEEVQSLLTLLFVQEYEVFKGCHINLQGSWLNGANLKEARLAKAILTRAHLQNAWLREAQLQGLISSKHVCKKLILARHNCRELIFLWQIRGRLILAKHDYKVLTLWGRPCKQRISEKRICKERILPSHDCKEQLFRAHDYKEQLLLPQGY